MNCGKYVSKDGSGHDKHRWGFFCALLKGHEGDCASYPEKSRQGYVLPKAMDLIEADMEMHRRALRILQEEKVRTLPDAEVICIAGGDRGCGVHHKVSDLKFVQTYWYTPPSGCTEGDYWNLGEGQFKCPSCGTLNRLYERPEVEALKPYFKFVEERYDR